MSSGSFPVHATLYLRCLDAECSDPATAEAVRAHLADEGCGEAGAPTVELAPYSSFDSAKDKVAACS